jgi:hypothetical protein
MSLRILMSLGNNLKKKSNLKRKITLKYIKKLIKTTIKNKRNLLLRGWKGNPKDPQKEQGFKKDQNKK